MAQLIVRNLGSDVVRALKLRAARNGRSAEEEHRHILRAALRSRPLIDHLLQMPNDGDDDDFARTRELPRDIEW